MKQVYMRYTDKKIKKGTVLVQRINHDHLRCTIKRFHLIWFPTYRFKYIVFQISRKGKKG